MTGIALILSKNMKRLRDAKSWTQDALAEEMGVALGTVAAWEAGRRWPELNYVIAMAEAFEVAESELFRDPDYKPKTEYVINQFGRLLAGADPERIRDALEILELGQEPEVTAASPRRSRKANS